MIFNTFTTFRLCWNMFSCSFVSRYIFVMGIFRIIILCFLIFFHLRIFIFISFIINCLTRMINCLTYWSHCLNIFSRFLLALTRNFCDIWVYLYAYIIKFEEIIYIDVSYLIKILDIFENKSIFFCERSLIEKHNNIFIQTTISFEPIIDETFD